MKRRTSTTPVKVYTYGCSHRGITKNAELVEQQYRMAHAYSQKLVELELARRNKIREVLNTCVDVAPLVSDLTSAGADLLQAATAVKAVRMASRSRRVPEEIAAPVKTLRAIVKEKRDVLRAVKADAGKTKETKAAIDEINKQTKASIKEARALSGCFWGSYLVVERSADQQRKGKMDPSFRPYDGSGRIVVQLQRGAAVAQVVGPTASDKRLQIVPITERPVSKRSDKIAHIPISKTRPPYTCRIRIGSEKRKPVWAEIEIYMHRPLPADGRITWAWLHRTRRGRDFVYQLQVTVEAKSFIAIPTGSKRIGLDLGWRVANKGAGGLRVAYWRDSTGQHGELRLPPRHLTAIDYASQLSGIETHWFEKAHAEYLQWRGTVEVPIEHQMRTQNIGMWKKARRLASYVWWWREHRFEGDAAIFKAMDEWRVRRFWHYRDWASHQRDKALAARKDFYRCFASVLMQDCAELVLEKMDLRKFATKGDDVKTETGQRYWQKMGAPSELRLALIGAAKGMGARITMINPVNTTRTCRGCGVIAKEAIVELNYTCAGCGATWDQDENAAINILERGEAA